MKSPQERVGLLLPQKSIQIKIEPEQPVIERIEKSYSWSKGVQKEVGAKEIEGNQGGLSIFRIKVYECRDAHRKYEVVK